MNYFTLTNFWEFERISAGPGNIFWQLAFGDWLVRADGLPQDHVPRPQKMFDVVYSV
jgi:hypothetical protein